ncbi:hypothetical protein ABGV42_01910 [Paenibacillus pabuli]|uniref:hypothetical protein n=1 Tax=Paenibacillus pabuli TaxID=1472 RepID=UPI00324225B1
MAKKDMTSAFEFYLYRAYQLFTGGRAPSDRPPSDTPLKEGYFFYSANRIYTTNRIKKVFFINELPSEIDANLITSLKDTVRKYGTLIAHFYSEPYSLRLDSLRTRSRVNIWEQRYNESVKKQKSQTKGQEILEKDSDAYESVTNKRMIDSFLYVKHAKKENMEFCKTSIMLELVSDSEMSFLLAESALKDKLYLNKIRFSETFMLTNEYYKSFSPVSSVEKSLIADKNPPYIFTDEVLSGFNYPTQGIFGDKYGFYMGTDRYTVMPTTINFKKDESAVNMLLAAETGYGKSSYVRSIINSAYMENDVYSVISDHEGDEYAPLGKLYDAATIDISGRTKSSRYFDTTEIGQLTGDPEVDYGLLSAAMDATRRVFDLLTDEEHGMSSTELAIFNDAYNNAHRLCGVVKDKPLTWARSVNMSYHRIYEQILELSNSPQHRAVYPLELIKFIDKLRVYFDDDGMYSHIFRDRIGLSEVVGQKVLIFSFGEGGKSQITTNSTITAIKQMFFAYISNLIANYNKFVLKGYTLVVFEEFQRYMNYKGAGQIATDHVTGGRKRNEIVLLVTNSPSQLIDVMKSSGTTNSEFGSAARAILDNIQCRILGYLKEESVESICDLFSIRDAKPILHEIREREEVYKHSFLINYRNESTVVRMDIPPELLASDVFRTRTTENDKVKK